MKAPRRVTKGKNELIFTYLNSTNENRATVSVGTEELDEKSKNDEVDVEVILLGPKRRKKKSSSSSSRRKEDKEEDDDETKDEDKPDEEDSSADKTEKPTDDVAPKRVNDSLLKQLERRYQESGALASDEDAYVDYMDYF